MDERHIQILPAAERDLPEIAALAQVIWRANYPGMISEAQINFMLDLMYSPETLRDEMLDRGIRFERLLVKCRPAGFAAYGPTGESGVFKLHKLYVHPDLQGTGLGSRLLTHCERASARLGGRQLILAVNKRNTRAIRVYERNGYALLNSVIVDIGGGFVMDDFVMVKALTDLAVRVG